jgi:hypothetical protein
MAHHLPYEAMEDRTLSAGKHGLPDSRFYSLSNFRCILPDIRIFLF